jgi:hypothetical protein
MSLSTSNKITSSNTNNNITINDGEKKRRGKEDNLTEKYENENTKIEKK